MALGNGVYSLIAGKVTDYYLCAKAIRTDVNNDAALAYLALLLDSGVYIQRHEMDAEELYEICRNAAGKNHVDIVEYLEDVIAALTVKIMLIDNPRLNFMQIIMDVGRSKDVFRSSIVKHLSKGRPGFFTISASRNFLLGSSPNLSLTSKLVEETDVVFRK